MRRLERRVGLAQQERDRVRGLVGRLHAEHEFEFLRSRVVPGEAAFRLEEHRINRLGLELAVQHQHRRIVARELGADLLAIGRGLDVSTALSPASGDHIGQRRILETSWADPACLDRRIDIGGVGRRAGDAGEAKGTVVGHHDRAGFLANI